MTPEEIAARLEKLETTLEEQGDELKESDSVRMRTAILWDAVKELAEAIKLLPDAYSMHIGGGKDQAGGKIRNIADKVLRDLH